MERTKYGKVARFEKSNPFSRTTYICNSCGKRTRETGDGESSVGLCAKCYEEGGLENEHSDNDGQHLVSIDADGTWKYTNYNPKCPVCRALREAGEI